MPCSCPFCYPALNQNPFWVDPADEFEEQCIWVELQRGGYKRCDGYVMTDGLCQYHYQLWRQFDRQTREALGEVDPWQEDEDTRVD